MWHMWFASFLWLAVTASAALQDAFRQDAIARYLESRRGFNITCLYTFDRFRPSVNVSAPSGYNATPQDTAADQMLMSIPPMFVDHVGDCPFGDLQFDPELVTSLDDGKSTSQLGVHLSEDPRKDVKRPQIASNDVVPSKEFYKWATNASHGFSFEFSYRRRVETNQTMTLFSIGNRHGSCVDPGFRVDLISTHVIMVNYFIPVLMGNDIACYERRLFSARINRCVLPRYRPNIDDNPVVHVVVTVDATDGAAALQSGFYLKYVDPVTMENYECEGLDAMKPPDDIVEYDYIQGTYRLYIGNNPRNVSHPLKRSKIAPVRQYFDPQWDDRPAEERLRDMIKQKLASLEGPRLPATFRLFGGKSLSMSVLTVPFPPVNEDTPFKWMRGAIGDFKKDHGDDIVDFIVKSLRDGEKSKGFGADLIPAQDDEDQASGQGVASNLTASNLTASDGFQGIYPNANGSAFDIFHFAIYHRAVSAKEVKEAFWSTWMTPFRPFMELKKSIRIKEGQEVLLDLLQLHSVFDDVKLEILQLPERGTVSLYPNKTALTSANVQQFRHLPMEQQHKIYFAPKPGEHNDNIKEDNHTLLKPYALMRFRVWKSTVGRKLNATRQGLIEIWVDPAPQLPTDTKEIKTIDVYHKRPVYVDVKSIHGSGGFLGKTNLNATSRLPRQLGLLDNFDLFGHHATNASSRQQSRNSQESIRILELPRHGRLYDRRMLEVSDKLVNAYTLDPSKLEPYRIRREWIANRTFSTSLAFIFDASSVEIGPGTVDLLQYQIDGGSATKNAKYRGLRIVEFHLKESSAPSTDEAAQANAIKLVDIVKVEEDSIVTITLEDLELPRTEPDIKFKIEHFPRHGKLYQYQQGPEIPSTLNDSIGTLINSSSTTVEDVRGRILYVPDPNYSNYYRGNEDSEAEGFDELPDWFTYSIVSAQGHVMAVNGSTAPLVSSSETIGTRLVQIQVASSPDALTILPPTVFATNCTRGDPVHAPVAFDDPDAFLGPYRVVLEAEDGVSSLELGHVVTDDDVLKYCSFERPCSLIRSANESFVSYELGDKHEKAEWQLLYKVNSRTWNPSKIEVEGSKSALMYALQRLHFRDMTRWTWDSEHTARIVVTIERSNSTLNAKTKMRYYVDFNPAFASDDTDSLGQALSNLADLASMGIWVGLLCFVLSSASCCSMVFCCCCTRARAEKRHQFEDERRLYIEQAVQNDHEYSSLLLLLVETLQDRQLSFAETLLRACGEKTGCRRSSLQVLCLNSLTPVLEADNLLVKLVVNLFSAELHETERGIASTRFAYPSLAGMTLAHFCNEKGGAWLRNFRQVVLSDDLERHDSAATHVLSALQDNISMLPTDIINICQRYAEIVSPESETGRIDAVHEVCFNHFIAPALWYMKRDSQGTHLPRSRRRKLRQAVRDILSLSEAEDPEEELTSPRDKDPKTRYKSLLHCILKHPLVHGTSNRTVEVDCDVIGACLMNLHSILEGLLPELEQQEKMREVDEDDVELPLERDEDVSGQLEVSSVAKVRRLLRALNFPLMSCEALVATFESSFASNPLFWKGFSREEWRVRVNEEAATNPASHGLFPSSSKQTIPRLRHTKSLLAVDIMEDEGSSSIAFEPSRSCAPSLNHRTSRLEFEF